MGRLTMILVIPILKEVFKPFLSELAEPAEPVAHL